MQTEVKRREIQGREVQRHAWMFIGGCSSPLAQWVVWSSPAISHDGATRHPPLHLGDAAPWESEWIAGAFLASIRLVEARLGYR